MSQSGEQNNDNSSVEESQFDLCEDAVKYPQQRDADNKNGSDGNEGQIVEPIQPSVENIQANVNENNSKTSCNEFDSELNMGNEEKQDEPLKLSQSQEKELETVFTFMDYPDLSVREYLAAKTQLTADFIQMWFVERRAKFRHQKNQKHQWEFAFHRNNHPNAQIIEELAAKAGAPKCVVEQWFKIRRSTQARNEKEEAALTLLQTSPPPMALHLHYSQINGPQTNGEDGSKTDGIPDGQQQQQQNEQELAVKMAEKPAAYEMSEWESVFLQNNNPIAPILEGLAAEAGVRKSVVEDWFQNRREQARVEEEKATKKLLQPPMMVHQPFPPPPMMVHQPFPPPPMMVHQHLPPPPMMVHQHFLPKIGPQSKEDGGNKAYDIPNGQQQREWKAKLTAIEEELRAIWGANKSATDCLDTSIGAEITKSNVVAHDEANSKKVDNVQMLSIAVKRDLAECKKRIEQYLIQNGLMEKQYVAESHSKEGDDAAQKLSDLVELKRKAEIEQAKVEGEQLNVVCRVGLWKYDNPKGNCWDKSVSQLSIDDNGLVGHKLEMGDWKQAFAQKPFQINANANYAVVNYFEISTKLTGYLQSSIRLGLSADNSIKQIGFNPYASSDPPKSFAFDCYPRDGIMHRGFYPGAPLNNGFFGGMPNKLAKEPKLTGQSDVFGCGILQKPNMAPIIFYTAQGELIGQYCPMEALEHPQLYPAIGLMNMATFEANFGDDLARRPFRYQIDKCPVLRDELLLV